MMDDGEKDVDRRRDASVQAAAYRQAAREPGSQPIPPLEAIFAKHHGAVFRAAYRITGNAMDAEDVLQTVFTRLLRRDGDLDLSQSAGSYLHRAAVNAALDLLRSRRRGRAVALAEVEHDLVDDAQPGPERQSRNRELSRRLRAAMSRLSPRQAEIFAMRYLEGLGNLEISHLLGSSQTAIAVILHRARHRLQRELQSLQGEMS
jgi:RNA polymerase sigma-70 factor (ECF subfamily)